jgi:hypothetical protein
MGDYWTNAVRHPEDIGVGHIRRTLDSGELATAGATVGMPIGALEAGAIPLRAECYVATLFNGTTPTITLGTTGTVAGIMSSADIAPATAGYKVAPATGAMMGVPLAADTVFYAYLTQTNTTAGKVTFIIEFVNKRESIVRPFPNN